MSGPGERIRLIVNADDLGWSEGVNAGIFRAHREGIVSSATLAANMPAAEAALAEARSTPGLGMGLHLNACQGPCLSAEAARVLAGPDGQMDLKGPGLIRRCLLRPRRTLAAVAAEFEAQVRWCLARGHRPTHVDTHRHVHAWPAIFRIVAALCRRYDIPFVRRHREVLAGGGWPPSPRGQRRISVLLNLLGWRCRRIAPELLITGGTLGVAHTGRIDTAFLLRAIETLRPGLVEIMVHPGWGADLDANQTRLLASREAETAALCDPAVVQAIARRGIELTNYGRLGSQPGQ